VQRDVLRPLGIHRMRIGHSLAEERVEGEVCYYTPRPETGMAVVGTPVGRPVPRPYGTWCLETMDAHGGWLGSAIDLVRFGSLLQINRNPGLLSPEMHAAMHQPPHMQKDEEGDGARKEPYYALGWQVRQVGEAGQCNLWHSGALPGVSTLLVLRHDGFCWAALFNTSFTSKGRRPADEIDGRIHAAVDKVPHWPEHDLFPEYVH
jgi:N-acyl-D-amino-acid deacylase